MVFELLEQQADAAGQWSEQVRVCARASLIVEVRSLGYVNRLASILYATSVRPLGCGQWGANAYFCALLVSLTDG